MNSIFSFLTRMDATARRAVLVTALLLLGVLAVLVFGKLVLFSGNSDEGLLARAEDILTSLRSSPLGLLAVIVLFCVLAFLGAPQFGLIGMTVLAFGPVLGFVYSWLATICSATLTFWIGRWSGMSLVRRYGGDSVQRMSRFMGRNALIASAVVRNVPTAPFIVVNMAFGASEARYVLFLIGLGLGIIPKTLLTALFGQVVAASLAGNPWIAAGAVIAMAALWIPLMLVARSRMAASPEGETVPDASAEEDGKAASPVLK